MELMESELKIQSIDFAKKRGNQTQNQAVTNLSISPCQGEGRGFKSPFPLQFSSSPDIPTAAP